MGCCCRGEGRSKMIKAVNDMEIKKNFQTDVMEKTSGKNDCTNIRKSSLEGIKFQRKWWGFQ